MLEGQSKVIYDVLKKLTGEDDVFKIIEAEEIIEKLPVEMSKVQLASIIRDLKDRNYISVKYFTPDEYCLLTLNYIEENEKAEVIVDDAKTVSQNTVQVSQKVKNGKKLRNHFQRYISMEDIKKLRE
ncbi:MAG: hypothetical protein MJ193_03665 [Clostridia bacterium]|nr:hypothetical protein [Clostridia bacterium]